MKTTFLIIVFLLAQSGIFAQSEKVLTGADLLISENMDLIKGKSLGIVTNHTAILSDGTHLVDSLVKLQGVHIAALFGPEHGIRGNAANGAVINDSMDPQTGIKVISLYGQTRKPTKEMLQGIDVLIYDIQDVGVRFYTFISTLYYVMEAAAENNIPVIVLDRPDPINGNYVAGPVRDDSLRSFVGIVTIPIAYGLTAGELAMLYNGEGMLEGGVKADLHVIKMKNWKRSSYYDETGLPWVKPSPNIPYIETTIAYPGTCLIEGTNVSEGRGTMNPFLQIGAPYIKSDELIAKMKALGIEGAQLDTISYIPKEIPGMATNPKYENELCHGVKIKVTDRNSFNSVDFGIKLIYALHQLYPNEFTIRESGYERLLGDIEGAEKIMTGKTPQEIESSWNTKLENFKKIRTKYIIY